MKITTPLLSLLLLCVGAMFVNQAEAAPTTDVMADVARLQQRWAEVNYELEGKTQLTAFEELVEEADNMTAHNPDSAPAFIWSGIIKSSFAGAKGGLGALKLAKASRADLEKAMALDPEAMQGSAYTSLGALYFKVPGWPVGFGDEEKAEELLQKALTLNPDGIDPNYFYGELLMGQKRYDEAERSLLKAQKAPARPDRALADTGRQGEIEVALLKVREKLDK